MRFFPKKKLPKKDHLWFAWYPVWAWDKKEHEVDRKLGTVWLEYVWVKTYTATGVTYFQIKE